jgi:hypothetical protein
MADKDPAISPPAVNIEDIMQEVRDEILSRTLPGRAKRPPAPRTLPPDFYEHLYRAGLAQGDLTIKPPIVKSTVPILGPLLDRIRQQFHQLVAYYFDHLAYKQSEINHHVLQALRQLDSPFDSVSETDQQGRIGRQITTGPGKSELASPDDVYTCYRLLLNREPAEMEWQDWLARLQEQKPKRAEVVDWFLNDEEFNANHKTGAGKTGHS